MAAAARPKTQSHPHHPDRRNQPISSSASASASASTTFTSTPLVVSSESPWCCAPVKPSDAVSPTCARHHSHRAAPGAKLDHHPPPPHVSPSVHPVEQPLEGRPTLRPAYPVWNPSEESPAMDAAAPLPAAAALFAPYPASHSRFNSALNAGLLKPMSPPPPAPLDKTRSSPTLFEMMANEQDCHARNQIPPPPLPPPPPGRHHPAQPTALLSAQERQLLLQDRVAEILGSCSPGNQLGDPDTGDVRLTLSSRDGLIVSMAVHRHVLVANSHFFASKLTDRWSKQPPQPQPQPQRSSSAAPQHIIEISDCDDVEIYVETLRLMYCRDLRRRLMKEDVPKVLAILQVSAAIGFDAGVLSCLEYLEAAPWAEEEEEKVASLLSQLRLENSGAGEVLKRVSLEVAASAEDGAGSNGGEEVLIRLLQVVLEGKDEKARREMKGLVSKMLRESNSGATDGGGSCINNGVGAVASRNDLSRESLYAACDGCLRLLRHQFFRAAASDLADAAQISRQADNLHWLLDILVDRQMAEDFLRTWAAQAELSEAHPRVPAIHRYEVSRVTARLFVGVGKGQILVGKEARCLLLETWLEPFYEDFGWMRRACKGLDRHLIEDGLANTILTLPLGLQQEILLAWFDRFLNSGDDCPNIQRGFEVWWRRAFWRRSGEPDRPPQLRIAAAGDNNGSC